LHKIVFLNYGVVGIHRATNDLNWVISDKVLLSLPTVHENNSNIMNRKKFTWTLCGCNPAVTFSKLLTILVS